MKTFLCTLMILVSVIGSASALVVDPQTENSSDSLSFEQMLHAWADSFMAKIPRDYTDTLDFHLQDSDESWYITLSQGNYQVIRGENPRAKAVVTGSYETYKRVFSGELNGMTAVARASIHHPAPLDFILKNDTQISDLNMNDVYFFIANFFNVHPHNKVLLGREHARKVHGGHAVGLYYSTGYRSAYYNIKKGEMINEAGEKDPWHQSFIIVEGQGLALLGQDTVALKAHEAYYIKPNSYHKVWTDSEEGISLIWSAWGKEAW